MLLFQYWKKSSHWKSPLITIPDITLSIATDLVVLVKGVLQLGHTFLWRLLLWMQEEQKMCPQGFAIVDLTTISLQMLQIHSWVIVFRDVFTILFHSSWFAVCFCSPLMLVFGADTFMIVVLVRRWFYDVGIILTIKNYQFTFLYFISLCLYVWFIVTVHRVVKCIYTILNLCYIFYFYSLFKIIT